MQKESSLGITYRIIRKFENIPTKWAFIFNEEKLTEKWNFSKSILVNQV
jgi:hypothetical protein